MQRIKFKRLASAASALARSIGVAALCAAFAPSAKAAAYVAVDLGPVKANGAYVGLSGPKQVGFGNPPTGGSHAAIWSGQPGQFVDLNPNGFFDSALFGGYVSGGVEYQVGIADAAQSPAPTRAALWSGSAGSYVDLGQGYAWGGYATPSGGQQVGDDNDGRGNVHAMLWSGSALSAVKLAPSAAYSSAQGGYYTPQGGRQVGDASGHAFVWSGTAGATDLHPATGFSETNANAGAVAASGGEWQVGYGQPQSTFTTHNRRALFWTGTAASTTDITPAFAAYGEATATHGSLIAGLAGVGGVDHAVLWTGPDPADVVDLHGLLPFASLTSEAYGVDALGNIVGTATDATGHNERAVVWLAVPEPAVLTWLVLGALALRHRTRRRH